MGGSEDTDAAIKVVVEPVSDEVARHREGRLSATLASFFA
jgi:hypothetical protein